MQKIFINLEQFLINIHFYSKKIVFMDRESLRPLVETALGNTKLTVLSAESFDAELDDALAGITDDAQVDDAFTKRIADRLIRMNGNIAKDAGAQINDWKKRHPLQAEKKSDEEEKSTGLTPEMQALADRLDALEKSNKIREAKAANDAVVAQVKDGLATLFKEGGITANQYFVDRAFADFKLPELGEGEKYDINGLVKSAESAYFSELKKAGIEYAKPRKGGGGKGAGPDKEALDRRAAFMEKQRRSGRLPKKEE